LARITAAGLTWPLPDDLTDVALEQRLFGRPEQTGSQLGKRHHAEPDWAALARELKRPGVNLMVLWEEYQQVHPEGYRYSRFCQLFRGFERKLSPVTQARYRARG
jgi:transposase